MMKPNPRKKRLRFSTACVFVIEKINRKNRAACPARRTPSGIIRQAEILSNQQMTAPDMMDLAVCVELFDNLFQKLV